MFQKKEKNDKPSLKRPGLSFWRWGGRRERKSISVREQRGGEIAVAGVRQQDNDVLARVLRALGQLHGRPHGRTGGLYAVVFVMCFLLGFVSRHRQHNPLTSH